MKYTTCCCWSLLYSVILHSWADFLHSHAILHGWPAFHRVFFNSHQSGVLKLKALAWLVPCERAAISARCVQIQPHTLSLHAQKVHACLAVTCYLHFCQNDQNLLHATAVTWGWNKYQSKSQHRKLTLEKKKILPPLLQGCEPATFQSWVRCSNHCAIPTPYSIWHHMVTSVQKGIRQI